LDSNGNPHIGYLMETVVDHTVGGFLKYAHWDGNSWIIQVVDNTSAYIGNDLSITVDSNGNPQISYYEFSSNDLRFASTQPLPVIPEFPSFLVLPIFIATTLLAVIIARRKSSIFSQKHLL
jgi:hypothetical protein